MSIQQPERVVSTAGYSVAEWCSAISICTATFYNLPDELTPESVRLRGRRIIIESPADYLRRVKDKAAA